ncbi:MAG: peptidylprolyl isomerase [Rhodobacteraceae bacterium]|nr:peptidylprolyl isomerase [Paracoccaceae bacterium]
MKWHRLIAGLTLCLVPAIPIPAQTDLFSTALSVNGQAISNYEIDQRLRIARLLDLPIRTRDDAVEQLIDERLYLQEAARLDIRLPASVLNQRIEAYAEARTGSAAALYADLRNAGISRDVFREYARANIIWEDVKAARFGAWASLLDADDVNQHAEFNPGQSTTLIDLSEIVISVGADDQQRGLDFAREVRQNIRSLAAFREAVEAFSLSPSKVNGGSIGWLPEAGLPGNVQGALRGVGAGSMTRPVIINGNVIMFYVHGRETRVDGNVLRGTSYATVRIGPGAGPAATLARETLLEVKTCRDLEQQSASIDGLDYTFHETVAQLPSDLAETIRALDAGEAAIISEGPEQMIVMLCQRDYLPEDDQEQAINSFRQQWLNESGNAYLSRLRADAIIRWN